MSLVHGNYTISTASLALYYDPFSPVGKGFDDASRTTVLDLSGNGRHCTRENLHASAATAPINYFTFTSASLHRLRSQYTYANITALSYECWLRTTTSNPTGILFQNRGTVLGQTSGRSITMGLTPAVGAGGSFVTTNVGRVFLGLDSDGRAHFRYTDIVVNDGIWHHIVGVFSRPSGQIQQADFQVYVDGVARTMTNGTSTAGVENVPITGLGGMTIGYHFEWNRSLGAPNGYLTGDMGAVRVYERALTATEILNTYNLERSKYGR